MADHKKRADWNPPNLEAPLPPAEGAGACPLEQVLAHAGERAQELVDNLQSFTAREAIEYARMDQYGVMNGDDRAYFEYAVGFEQLKNGLKVTEVRAPVNGGSDLPADFRDTGLPAIALVFHPLYQGDYAMQCEGAAEEQGERAWVIRFEQRKNKRSRTRAFNTDKGAYPAKLKGRAWISAESGQVMHVETGLMTAIAMLHLKSDGVRVEYAPVKFESKDLTLWLPQTSETYSDFDTYKIIVKHEFSHFLLSSVQIEPKINEPPRN